LVTSYDNGKSKTAEKMSFKYQFVFDSRFIFSCNDDRITKAPCNTQPSMQADYPSLGKILGSRIVAEGMFGNDNRDIVSTP
jgi:hypothetical protein